MNNNRKDQYSCCEISNQIVASRRFTSLSGSLTFHSRWQILILDWRLQICCHYHSDSTLARTREIVSTTNSPSVNSFWFVMKLNRPSVFAILWFVFVILAASARGNPKEKVPTYPFAYDLGGKAPTRFVEIPSLKLIRHPFRILKLH